MTTSSSSSTPYSSHAGWASLYTHLQEDVAPDFVSGEFFFVGEPFFDGTRFAASVFSLDRGRVEVLRGARDLALTSLKALLIGGELGVCERRPHEAHVRLTDKRMPRYPHFLRLRPCNLD